MMTSKRFTLRAAVYLLPIKGNNILLLRRFNTGWMDGKYSLVAGHMDGNETVKQAMIREAKEEAGIDIIEDDLEVVHVMHRKDDTEYVDFFLTVKKWKGEIAICESDKCDDLSWFLLDQLPENILPYVRLAIENYQHKIFFSEFIE